MFHLDKSLLKVFRYRVINEGETGCFSLRFLFPCVVPVSLADEPSLIVITYSMKYRLFFLAVRFETRMSTEAFWGLGTPRCRACPLISTSYLSLPSLFLSEYCYHTILFLDRKYLFQREFRSDLAIINHIGRGKEGIMAREDDKHK